MTIDLDRVKLALAIMGLVIFAAGIRLENGRLRLIGIGFFAAAFLLRFVRRSPPRDPPV
jgi:hypothetical protein